MYGSVPTTVPVPARFLATVMVTLLKVAVTVRAAVVIVTVHVTPLTDVQPTQLRKFEFASGTAVRVTTVSLALLLKHVVPQLMFPLVPF